MALGCRGTASSPAANKRRHPATPILIAVDLSPPIQPSRRGRLDTLGFLVRAISDDAPTLLLIGEAVAQPGRAAASAAAARSMPEEQVANL